MTLDTEEDKQAGTPSTPKGAASATPGPRGTKRKAKEDDDEHIGAPEAKRKAKGKEAKGDDEPRA